VSSQDPSPLAGEPPEGELADFLGPPPGSPGAETWQSALSRRLRSLLRTAPFHRLEAARQRGEGDLPFHDLRALALRALDATIEKMGRGEGATRQDLDEALNPLIRAAEPGIAPERAAEIVTLVLDGLLNERERRQAFSEAYAEFGERGVTARQLSFHLLREEELPSGLIVARATTEGVNLYAGMLEYDVEDAQTAEEAVLRSQIRRGRIAEAVATAQRARLRSIEYEGKLLGILQTTRRDVSQVAWVHEVVTLLQEARLHLEERQEVELALIVSVEAKLDRAEAAVAPQYVALLQTLKECHARHLRLHGRLMGANQQYLDEQERQSFRPRLLLPLADLEAEVLRPALELPVGLVAGFAGRLLADFHPPRVRALLSLPLLIDRLLAPRRAEEAAYDQPSPDLDLVDQPDPPFTREDELAVEDLLAEVGTSPVALSALRAEARDRGLGAGALHLLVLRTLQVFDRELEAIPFRSEATGQPLRDPAFVGDDLWLSRDLGRTEDSHA